jgi:hypothetical protein
MFHPEFRNLIERDAQDQEDQENQNQDQNQDQYKDKGFVLFPQYMLSGIVVVFINAMLMLAFMYGIYEGIGLTVTTGYVMFNDFWSSLTEGCEWVEFIILSTSVAICVILIMFMSIMADAWEKSRKMSDESELKLKLIELELTKRIKQLELELEDASSKLMESSRTVKSARITPKKL